MAITRSACPTSSLPPLPRRLLCSREDRDPIAAHRTNPELPPDLDGHGAGAERVTVGVANELLKLQRVRIDLHHVRALQGAFPPWPAAGSAPSGAQRRLSTRNPTPTASFFTGVCPRDRQMTDWLPHPAIYSHL